MKLAYVVLAAALASTACKKKEPPFEEAMATMLARQGMIVPEATGATSPLPEDGILVLITRGTVEIEQPRAYSAFSSFGLDAGGMVIFTFDPARAATEGAAAKYKRTPTADTIVPLENAVQSYIEQGRAKKMFLASVGPPPDKLLKEIRASFAADGVTEQYRIVRGKDGKVAVERLP